MATAWSLVESSVTVSFLLNQGLQLRAKLTYRPFSNSSDLPRREAHRQAGGRAHEGCWDRQGWHDQLRGWEIFFSFYFRFSFFFPFSFVRLGFSLVLLCILICCFSPKLFWVPWLSQDVRLPSFFWGAFLPCLTRCYNRGKSRRPNSPTLF